MIVDAVDLKLIRSLELNGSISVTETIGKVQASEEEIILRIKNFEEAGFIKSYGMKLFIPGIIGGVWFWGCLACETDVKYKIGHAVPILEEIVQNVIIPTGVSPDRSLLFYTQNLKDSYKIINRLPGIKYAEVYKIDEYDIRVPRLLLKEHWQVISKLHARMAKIDYLTIHRIVNKPETEDEMMLSRLIWTKKNRKGVITLLPNYDWSVIKNYLHLHVAVTTKLRTKELQRLVNRIGFCGNITGRFKKRYYQIEFELWGFSDMQNVINSLSNIGRVSVEGLSFAHKNQIYDAWLKDFINSKI